MKNLDHSEEQDKLAEKIYHFETQINNIQLHYHHKLHLAHIEKLKIENELDEQLDEQCIQIKQRFLFLFTLVLSVFCPTLFDMICLRLYHSIDIVTHFLALSVSIFFFFSFGYKPLRWIFERTIFVNLKKRLKASI